MAFNPQAFLGNSGPTQMPMQSPTEDPAPASPAAAPVPTVAPKGFDPQRFLNGGAATDQLTGAKIPLAYSGNTPETAMNKNALSAQDRMNLSFGNEKGNLAYLKARFPDAKPILDEKGNPTRELAYRQGNTWYRVDPKNGDIADPWEKTKEYMKDAASFAPEALGIAVATGTDLLTGVAALPASAAVAGATAAGVRTSLGRLVGTYDATPAEQAWDVGFESLLNAAGAKVLTGVKPGAKWMANRLDTLAEAFKDTAVGGALAGAPKGLFKKVFASYSVGENNFDTMLENTSAVKSTMGKLSDMAGGDLRAYHDQAIRNQVDSISKTAGGARQALTDIYSSMRNKILAKVPASFSTNLEEHVYTAYSDALKKGIGELRVAGKSLQADDAVKYLAEHGTRKAAFRMFSQDEMTVKVGQGARLDTGLGFLSANTEAHGVLEKFYKTLDRFTGGVNRTGPEGARDLLDFKKVVTDLSNTLANSEAAQGINEVRFIINSAKASMDNSVHNSFKDHALGDAFRSLNSEYDKLSTGFAPLLQAQKQAIASGNTRAYEGLLSTFLANPKPTASARFAIDDAIKAADANGLKSLADGLRKSKLDIKVTEAAKAFNPIKPGILKAAQMGTAAAGIGAYALNHPEMAAVMMGIHAVTTPTASKIAVSTVQGLSKGQEFLSKLTKRELNTFLSSPQAISAFTTGVVQTPLVRAQADQGMQQALQQATQGPQQ